MAQVNVSKKSLSARHSRADGPNDSHLQWRWETDLQAIMDRIHALEQQCSGSNNAHEATLKTRTSAEFLKLCNRVDALDGKISAMKTVLEEVLRELNLKSDILDKSLPQSWNHVPDPLPEAPKTCTSRNKKAQDVDLESNQHLRHQQFMPAQDYQDEQQFIGIEDDDGHDDWLPAGVEAEYEEDDDEALDIKPFVETLESFADVPGDCGVDSTFANESLWPEETGTMRPKSKQKLNLEPVMKLKEIRDPQEIQTRYPPLDSNSLERNFATKMFECPVCQKEFKERTKVERHYVMHSGERPFACVNCRKTFTRKDKLTEHYRSAHPKNIPPEHVFEKKEKKTYACPDCGKVSLNKGSHEDHLNACRGTKPHICPHCGKGFTQNVSLRTHIHCVHQKIKRFLCADCGKAFSISASYQRHMRMHRGDRPFACKYCDKTFLDSSALSRHHKAHAGIKTVKCHLCDLIFYKYYALNQHMKTHTGEKRFACDECGTTFGQVGSLNKHKLLHLKNGKVRIRKSFQRKAPYKPREPKVAIIPELCARVLSPRTESSQVPALEPGVLEEQCILPLEDQNQILQRGASMYPVPISASSASSFSPSDCNFGFQFQRQHQA